MLTTRLVPKAGCNFYRGRGLKLREQISLSSACDRQGDRLRITLQMKQKTFPTGKRLAPAGAALLASTVGVTLALAALLAMGVPYANAGDEAASVATDSADPRGTMVDEHSKSIPLDKKFKGKLPITELT